MKKFLTVLLVIAVMFTFSFGSAFATVSYSSLGTAEKVAVDKAIDYMYNFFETKVYDKATAEGITVTTDGIKISADSFAAVKAEALAEVKAHIKNDAATADYTGVDFTADPAVIADKIFNGKAYSTVTLFNTELKKAYDSSYVAGNGRDFELSAAQAEVKATYDAAVKMFELVNYDAYSTTSPSEANSYQKQAKAAVDTNLTLLYNSYVAIGGSCTPANLTDMTTCKNAIELIDTAAKIGLKAEKYADTSIDTGFYLVNDANIKTIAEEEASAPTDAANVAVVKANIAKIVADFTKDHGTVTGASAASKAYTEMYNYLAEYYVGKTLPTLDYDSDAIQIKGSADNTATVKTAYLNVTDLEALAAKLKAEKDANGNLVRDAKEIDKILVAATSDIYTVAGKAVDSSNVTAATTNNDGVSYTYATAAAALTNCTVDGDAAEFEFVKAAKKSDLEDALKAAIDEDLETYYALEAEKVKVAYETAIAAVEAAAAPKDITAAEAALGKALKVIKNSDQVDDLFNGTAIETYIDEQVTNIEMLVDYKNAAAGALSHQDAFIAKDTAKTKLVEYYIDNNARTLAEVKALAEEAANAVVAKLPTNADIAAAKKAAEDAIKALPAVSKITVADKDAVAEVLDLMDAYADLGGTASTLTGYRTVSDKVDAVIADLKREATKAYTLADKTDKAALDAVQDQIDESNDFIARQLDRTPTGANKVSVPAITTALDKIRTAEQKAAQKAIDELPINVTAADKAQVEAARALYDAYVAKWQDVESGYYAANDIDARDLDLAEAVLGLNQPDPEENAKAYVQDLSIKARSVKTSKGVKVTIKADVQPLLDEGFTVEYKFYRSTKSNKNFGTAKVTKTENTYLNTSGKKGTKYYYKAKLVVKNAAGEVVATTPLTQCLYATRTF